MFCNYCGKELEARARFCAKCGEQVQDITPTVVAAAPVAPTTILMPEAAPTVAPFETTVLRDPGQIPSPSPQVVTPAQRRISAPVLAVIIVTCVLLVAGGIVTAVLLLSSSSSSSSSKVTIPDLKGKTYDTAKAQLENAGLKVSRNDVTSDKDSPDHVISMSPTAGQQVDKGATVKLDVTVKSGNGGNVNDQAAYETQMDGMILELTGLDGTIKNTATEINNSIDVAHHTMTTDMVTPCNGLLASLSSLRSKAQAMKTPAKFSQITKEFIQLVDYCTARVNAMLSGISTVGSGGDYVSAFDQGVAPKNAFNTEFPILQQDYATLKAQ